MRIGYASSFGGCATAIANVVVVVVIVWFRMRQTAEDEQSHCILYLGSTQAQFNALRSARDERWSDRCIKYCGACCDITSSLVDDSYRLMPRGMSRHVLTWKWWSYYRVISIQRNVFVQPNKVFSIFETIPYSNLVRVRSFSRIPIEFLAMPGIQWEYFRVASENAGAWNMCSYFPPNQCDLIVK